MKKALKILLLILITLPVLVFIAGQTGQLRGQRPSDLGAKAGLLKPPGEQAQNVVSSQAKLHPHAERHVIAPLSYSGEPGPAMAKPWC